MSRKPSNLLVGAFVFILLSYSLSNGQQGTDEALIRKTLEDYYASLVNKDGEAVKALWSQDSPELESHMMERIRAFQAADKVELKALTIDNIRVMGNTAQAEVGAVFSDRHSKGGAVVDHEVKSNQFVTLVKESGGWKLYRVQDASRDFFIQFVKAQTKEARAGLIRDRGRHVTDWMVPILLNASMDVLRERRYEHALELADKAFELAEHLGSEAQIGLCHGHKGAVFLQQSQYARAMGEFLLALPLLRKGGERGAEAETLRGIERAFKGLQKSGESPRFAQRIEVLLACLPIAREIDNKSMELNVLQSLVDVYMESGKFEEALRASQSAFLLAKRTNDKGGQGLALVQVGSAYEAIYRYDDALNVFEQLEAAMISSGELDKARLARQEVIRLRKLLRR